VSLNLWLICPTSLPYSKETLKHSKNILVQVCAPLAYLTFKGGDINSTEPWNGTSLLMQAAFLGDVELVKFLLRNHANIDQVDLYKQTPLMFAALKVKSSMFAFFTVKREMCR
jgi:ankyrin repeat protein